MIYVFIRPDVLFGCLFHKITGFPCPACGSTRSVASILHGDMLQAWHYNPFGFPVAALMLIVPVWILADRIGRNDDFFYTYQRIETLFKRKIICIPAIALVLCNWIWNFFKY
jgi:hypothetical protein